MRTKLTALLLGFLLAISATVVLGVGSPGDCIWPCTVQVPVPPSAWQTITYNGASWQDKAARVPLRWRYIGNGVVWFNGCTETTDGASKIGDLPAAIIPTTKLTLPAVDDDASIFRRFEIRVDGSLHTGGLVIGSVVCVSTTYEPAR